jgi:hypothetical protein
MQTVCGTTTLKSELAIVNDNLRTSVWQRKAGCSFRHTQIRCRLQMRESMHSTLPCFWASRRYRLLGPRAFSVLSRRVTL